MTSDEYRIELAEDRPITGMWHCGPNAAWVTVTHLPTMISARAFDIRHHKAREAAMACCQMMVDATRADVCSYPERLVSDSADAKAMEARQGRDGEAGSVHDSAARQGLPEPQSDTPS